MDTHLTRTFALSRDIDTAARTVALAASSEEPYRRSWGVEILDHSPTSIDLSRLADGRHPLLLNHDWDRQIGVVESVEIGGDRRLRANVRLSRSALGEEVLQDVVDGIRSLVSIGYTIEELQEIRADEGGVEVVRTITDFPAFERAARAAPAGDDVPTYRVTRWCPYEISICSIPADTAVGVGRAAGAEAEAAVAAPPSAALTEPISQEKKIMSEVQAPAAPAIIDAQADAKHAAAEISRIAKQYANYGAEALAVEMIAKGASVEQFTTALLEKQETVSKIAASAGDLGLSKKEAQHYSVLRAIRGLVDKDWRNAGFEKECHEAILKRAGVKEAPNNGIFMPVEVQKRDMTSAGASGSNYLVATDNLAASFIDLLRNRATVAQLGATMLTGLQGNVTIPKQTAASTAYWLTNEATAITESQPTIGQLSLAPKNLGAYTEISRQLMLQNSPAADTLVMNDFARVLALAIDLAAYEGAGSGGAPTGISGTSGIGSVTGSSIDYAKVLEFQTDVAGANALAGNCAYVTTPAVAAILMQRLKVASTYSPLWEGSVLDGQMVGFRALATNQVTAATMVFGDFSQVVIAEWGMLELAMNPYANFAAAITGVRAIQTVDIGIRQAGAFSRATSIS